jgi:excinuclease ABC subunit C
MASRLDSIPGIGPNRRRALLTKFGSIDRIQGATVEQLQEVPGITEVLARSIIEHLE